MPHASLVLMKHAQVLWTSRFVPYWSMWGLGLQNKPREGEAEGGGSMSIMSRRPLHIAHCALPTAGVRCLWSQVWLRSGEHEYTVQYHGF
jgi:hypothetical protein